VASARGRRARGSHGGCSKSEGDVVLTSGPGDAARLAEAFVARDVDRVIGWGGDGTMNEIAGRLRGGRTILGIVPSGSGDGLARSLGLPREADRALSVALERPPRSVDMGFLGARHFLNIAGVGFDAAIARVFNARRQRGALGYVTGSLSLVWSYQCLQYQVQLGDETVSSEERFLIAFANGREYGNGIVLAPEASPSDGWLDAVVVSSGSAIRQLWRARRLAIGRLLPAEGVLRRRVQHATVSGDRLDCHVDGETFEMSGTVTVRIEPGAIKIAGAG